MLLTEIKGVINTGKNVINTGQSVINIINCAKTAGF
jgi:hypothetical protein